MTRSIAQFRRFVAQMREGKLSPESGKSLAVSYFNLFAAMCALAIIFGVPFVFVNKIGALIVLSLLLGFSLSGRKMALAGHAAKAIHGFAVLIGLVVVFFQFASQKTSLGGIILLSFLPVYGAIAGYGFALLLAAVGLAGISTVTALQHYGVFFPQLFPGGPLVNIVLLLITLPLSLLPFPSLFKQINESQKRAEEESTERLIAQQALKETAERLVDFSANATDWFWETDTEHRLTYLSHLSDQQSSSASQRLIGYTRWDLDDVKDIDQKERWQYLRTLLDARLPFRDFEYMVRTSRGALQWISMSGKPIFDSNNAFQGYRGNSNDITLKKMVEAEITQAREAAELANRAKSQFLSNLSHEIRTPLNGISGMANLLEMTTVSEEQRPLLDELKTSTGLLKKMLERILDFAQLEAGAVKARIAPFSLTESCEILMARHVNDAKRKGLDFGLSKSSDLPELIFGDADRVLQVLDNLIDNAIKFTTQGRVSLGVSLEELSNHRAWIRFTVTDTGPGMPVRIVEENFPAFSQGDGSFTRDVGGHGIGLSICRCATSLLKGRMSVEPNPEGGSIFHVSLPFEAATES